MPNAAGGCAWLGVVLLVAAANSVSSRQQALACEPLGLGACPSSLQADAEPLSSNQGPHLGHATETCEALRLKLGDWDAAQAWQEAAGGLCTVSFGSEGAPGVGAFC